MNAPFLKFLVIVLAIVVGIWLIDRLFRWMKRKGWMYYKKQRPRGSMRSVFNVFQEFYQPEIRHVHEDQRNRAAESSGNKPVPSTLCVQLRDVLDADLPIFFEQQLDADANHMAAFTCKDPADRDAFDKHWARIIGDPTILKKTVLFDGRVAGHVMSFEQAGEREVCYWMGKEFWGRGIATCALKEFLNHVNIRPLYARVANDNAGSIRVLEKCGFEICGKGKWFSNARGAEIEELILKYEAR